ncbi:hypothetical protein IEO21_01437 [Rhodonia placenta]|uniref:Uncharacterized protein n=1 Tax=Rhodonia placenta TaxID=104341 RepID=A0A8H7P9Z7_9APHY|nr:hypothetical protein IEO21_01437 [Postia placenta]
MAAKWASDSILS